MIREGSLGKVLLGLGSTSIKFVLKKSKATHSWSVMSESWGTIKLNKLNGKNKKAMKGVATKEMRDVQIDRELKDWMIGKEKKV